MPADTLGGTRPPVSFMITTCGRFMFVMKKEAKARKVRDEKICKELKHKSWDGKKVIGFVTCFHCAKRRCVYTGVEQDYLAARVAFQQKLESVSGRFSCGDLLFDDDHPLSKVIVQKQSLTCESQIEKAYYNKIERALKLKDLCIYCGSGADDEEEDDTFLLRLPQLQERLMTDGYVCFPICITCVKNGKKVVKVGKKDTAQARVERIARLGN
eukprot:scaffold340_cov190-Chaetoceros_neogracile.AAC.7